MKDKKNIIIILIAVAVLLMWVVWSRDTAQAPSVQELPGNTFEVKESAAQVVVSIAIDDVIVEAQEMQMTPGTTALGLLEHLDQSRDDVHLQTEEYVDLGTLVSGIGPHENGDDNRYWHYYVNGVLPMIGADQYELQHTDRVEWKFEPAQL